MGAEEDRERFLQGNSPWLDTHALVDGPTSMHTDITKGGSASKKEKRKKIH